MRRWTIFALFASVALIWAFRTPDLAETGVDGVDPIAGSVPGVVVFDLQDNASQRSIEEFEARYGVDLEYSSRYSEDEALMRVRVADPAALIRATAGDSLVEVAEPLVELHATGFPDDPMWDRQWNMRLIGVERGWRSGGGRGVRVAVIDTGVTRVEDLAGTTFGTGRSFVPGIESPDDDNGHGTHVAGTIAQTTNNGVGVVGIAPNVVLMPYKALDARGSGSSDWIAAAVDDAVDEGADVINLSLGGGHSDVLHNAVIAAADAGVIVVIASGNEHAGEASCPAHAHEVIGVGAVGPDDRPAPYSNYGPGVEITAPGGNSRVRDGGILQDTIGQGGQGESYRSLQGTSMASPHVAGAAAVLLGTGLDSDSVVDTLLATARHEGAAGLGPHGYGRLDLGAAIRRVALRRNMLLFLLAGLVTAAFTGLGGWKSRPAVNAITIAMICAGGFFFLPLLPFAPSPAAQLFSNGIVFWPAAVVSPDWVHFPLWCSALLPVLAAMMLGPSKRLGPAALGFSVAFGLTLLHGALTSSIGPWGMRFLGLDRAWLLINAVICLMAAMAVVGIQQMRFYRTNSL